MIIEYSILSDKILILILLSIVCLYGLFIIILCIYQLFSLQRFGKLMYKFYSNKDINYHQSSINDINIILCLLYLFTLFYITYWCSLFLKEDPSKIAETDADNDEFKFMFCLLQYLPIFIFHIILLFYTHLRVPLSKQFEHYYTDHSYHINHENMKYLIQKQKNGIYQVIIPHYNNTTNNNDDQK